MKPGKKSAASLTLAPINPLQRPDPPASLNANESRLWRDITASLAADWFRPADLPLLTAYCQAATEHQDAAKIIAGAGLMLTDTKGRKYRNPMIAVCHQSALRMAGLAVKMRLCPSTRYTAKTAGTAIRNTPTANIVPPWEK